MSNCRELAVEEGTYAMAGAGRAASDPLCSGTPALVGREIAALRLANAN